MAHAAELEIRQILMNFWMANLRRRARTVSDYDTALRRAVLHTPRDIIQNTEQLESLLLEDLTETEIFCLIAAAVQSKSCICAEKYGIRADSDQFSRLVFAPSYFK